jgi:hypothetical protein
MQGVDGKVHQGEARSLDVILGGGLDVDDRNGRGPQC